MKIIFLDIDGVIVTDRSCGIALSSTTRPFEGLGDYERASDAYWRALALEPKERGAWYWAHNWRNFLTTMSSCGSKELAFLCK